MRQDDARSGIFFTVLLQVADVARVGHGARAHQVQGEDKAMFVRHRPRPLRNIIPRQRVEGGHAPAIKMIRLEAGELRVCQQRFDLRGRHIRRQQRQCFRFRQARDRIQQPGIDRLDALERGEGHREKQPTGQPLASHLPSQMLAPDCRGDFPRPGIEQRAGRQRQHVFAIKVRMRVEQRRGKLGSQCSRRVAVGFIEEPISSDHDMPPQRSWKWRRSPSRMSCGTADS